MSNPVITSFSPTAGTVGETVTIVGSNFTGTTGVTFNGFAAGGFAVVDDNHVTATVPAGIHTGTIAVTNLSGTGTSVDTFTEMAGAISLTKVSFGFTHGPTTGSATIRIEGTNFAPNCVAKVGGNTVTINSYASSLLICTTTAHVSGVVTVSVTNPDTTSSLVVDAYSFDSSTVPVLDPVLVAKNPTLRVNYLMCAENTAAPGPLAFWSSPGQPDMVGLLSGITLANLQNIAVVEAFWSA